MGAGGIVAHLERGIDVLTDRYYLSSFAYQGMNLLPDVVTTAKGLAGVPRPTGALGPNLKRLDQLLDTATEIKSSIKLRLSEKHVVDLVLRLDLEDTAAIV